MTGILIWKLAVSEVNSLSPPLDAAILAFNVLARRSFVIVDWKLDNDGVTLSTLNGSEYEGVGEIVPIANSQWKSAAANNCNSREVLFFISTWMKTRSNSFNSTFSKWRREVSLDPFKSVFEPSMVKWEIIWDPGVSSWMLPPETPKTKTKVWWSCD